MVLAQVSCGCKSLWPALSQLPPGSAGPQSPLRQSAGRHAAGSHRKLIWILVNRWSCTSLRRD
eukprot:8689648-Alexandrium_andersonii.AAC.1